jgi:hypothetical protein
MMFVGARADAAVADVTQRVHDCVLAELRVLCIKRLMWVGQQAVSRLLCGALSELEWRMRCCNQVLAVRQIHIMYR